MDDPWCVLHFGKLIAAIDGETCVCGHAIVRITPLVGYVPCASLGAEVGILGGPICTNLSSQYKTIHHAQADAEDENISHPASNYVVVHQIIIFDFGCDEHRLTLCDFHVVLHSKQSNQSQNSLNICSTIQW